MTRPPMLRAFLEDELVVDNFAGGGGASVGIENALGRSPDIAVNHDPEAIAMHEANHPGTTHYCESVWDVDPVKACSGKSVALAWFSPDCKHFSRAKGGKPVDKNIRGLAWLVTDWAKAVRPRVIILENVEEFQDWGPLDEGGLPDKTMKGFTFRRWCQILEGLGYKWESRILRGCDYGAPTIRKRLFIIARCDDQPIAWPEPTHGPETENPYLVAADCIDWSIDCPSIFTRKRPLADNTLRRIAKGIKRYVLDSADPFIIPVTHQGDSRAHSIREPLRTITGAHRGELSLVTAFLAQHYGARATGGWNEGKKLDKPIGSITARDSHALVTSHLMKFYGTSKSGRPMTEPMPTITANGRGGGHIAEVRAFLLSYYGTDQNPYLTAPMPTATTRDRFGLVTVHGTDYAIIDIGMRMLQPHELYAAQGFPADYNIKPQYNGKPMTKTAQVRMCGNSVCPPIATALVSANFATEQLMEVSGSS